MKGESPTTEAHPTMVASPRGGGFPDEGGSTMTEVSLTIEALHMKLPPQRRLTL